MSDVPNKRKIIFVCVGNSCRSQMAEGFAKHYAEKLGIDAEIRSGGTRPQGYVHPEALKVMAEKGIDISKHQSKGINPQELKDFDVVISMGCSDKRLCPVNFRGVSADWGIEDPFDQPIEAYRKARDQIEVKVKELFNAISK
jgi:arsenate reductase